MPIHSKWVDHIAARTPTARLVLLSAHAGHDSSSPECKAPYNCYLIACLCIIGGMESRVSDTIQHCACYAIFKHYFLCLRPAWHTHIILGALEYHWPKILFPTDTSMLAGGEKRWSGRSFTWLKALDGIRAQRWPHFFAFEYPNKMKSHCLIGS